MDGQPPPPPEDGDAAPWPLPQGGEDPKLLLARKLKDYAGQSHAALMALNYAALSSTFRPERAMTAAGLDPAMAEQPDSPEALRRFAAAAQLAQACDTQIWQPDWIMRTVARARQIETMDGRQQNVADVVAWRRVQPGYEADAAAQAICDALLGEGDFAPDRVDAALAAGLDPPHYERLIRGISLALPLSPARDRIEGLRAALARAEGKASAAKAEQPVERDEVRRITTLVEAQWGAGAGPETLRITHVCGGEGVGKSTLLAQVRQSFATDRTIGVTLDFDRPGIDGSDLLGLSTELARQVAEAVGPEGGTLYAAIDRAQGDVDEQRSNVRLVAQTLLDDVAGLLDTTGRRLLLSLDTLDALTLRGDTAAVLLLQWLQALRAQTARVAILAAGRTALPPQSPLSALAEQVVLGGLPEEAVLKRLEALDIGGASATRIAAFARGNPLLLQLGVRFAESGQDALLATDKPDAAALYRQFLLQLEPEDLRPAAEAGLLLRQVNAALLADVILPAIGGAGAPADLLARLAGKAWLVETRGDWRIHQEELRGALLDGLIDADPARAQRIFAAAADWHGGQGEALPALYYRLQHMRWGDAAPTVDPNLAAHMPYAMLAELPDAARNAIALARGERSSLFRPQAPGSKATAGPFGPDAAAELQMLLERRARFEAAMMVRQAQDFSAIDPASPAGAAVIEALWRGGDFPRAQALLAARRAGSEQPFPLDDASFHLIAAFADLDPLGFRAHAAAHADWAMEVARRIGETGARTWDVPGLLLRAEGFETRHAFADALWPLWTADRPESDPPAVAPDLSARVVQLARDPLHRDLLLAGLQGLPSLDGLEPIALETAQALLGTLPEEEAADYVGSFAVERVDALGGLAFFAARMAREHPVPMLEPLFVRIARRRATVAGRWAYGPQPAGWRNASAAEARETAATPFERRAMRALIQPMLAEDRAPATPGSQSPSRSTSAQRNQVMPDVLEAEVQIAPSNPIQEESRGRLASAPSDMREAAQRAIAKGLIDPANFGFSSGDNPAASPLESVDNPVALEAIVLLTGRPPMLIRNDRVVIDPIAQNAMGPGTGLSDLNPGVISGVEPMIPSIGRIEFINHQMQWGGTGFVIPGGKGDRRFVVTNRHVAKLVARRQRDGSGLFLRSPQGIPYKAKIDMREEFQGAVGTGFECPVERIVYLADDTEADCALLEISMTATCKPGELALADKRADVNELVAAIGYPAYDERNEVAPMRKYFGDIYNVKRFAPGRIMQSAPGDLLMHDCTTLGGNSGSALISLSKKAVVGLHFSGSFGIGNSAVSVETLKQLQTGRLFAVTAAPTTAAEAPGDDGVHQPEHFAGREGFDDEGFLQCDLGTPIPAMDDAVLDDLVIPSDGTAERPKELRYTNFSVFYSRSRKTPRFTAVNIDGEKSVRIKRGSDTWFFDLRIPRELQLSRESFLGALDRGHMVRREDPNFGPDAQRANDDTFHYTNAALQHAGLNQGKSLWQGLENYILDSARTEGFRACVFTGPILDDEDPLLGLDDLQIPLQFWKVVVMPKVGGGLHATGYLLSQGDLIRKLLEERSAAGRGGNESQAEGFQLGAYRTFQIAIKHIEQATGLRWAYLDGADPLAELGNEAVSPVTYTPIDSADDLIL